MQKKIEIQTILPDSNYTCFVIPALFSEAECEDLLNPEIKISFQEAISNYPTYYRNNERFVIDNNNMANWLFEKVKPYLPLTLSVNSSIKSETGQWRLIGLNTRLRFCKYSAKQYFHRHLDGIHHHSATVQSKLTFMIYLNSATEFKGGRTLFFKTKETTEIWASYVPKKGDLIVFDHNVWHEGEVLQEGEKFVLRSDILYSKNNSVTRINEPFAGHLGYIWALLKLNKNTIISGGRDKEIKIWSITGKEKKSLKEHHNSILCIEKINDDTFITGSRDQQIIIWENYKAIRKINVHSAVILSLCKLDDTTIISSSGDKSINILSIDGEVFKTLKEHTAWVWKVVKINTTFFASCSEDGTLKIWNKASENSIVTFTENYPIISLTYNEQTKQLISGNLNGEISIRTLNATYTQKKIKQFKTHNGLIRTIKIIDNKRFATGAEDNKVKIWRTDGSLISEFQHQNFVQSIELLDSNTLISASYDGTIQLFKIDTNE